MDAETFRAERRDTFVRTDEELTPLVERALVDYGAGVASWADDLIEAADVLWLEFFQKEAPNADHVTFLRRFNEMLGEALKQTEEPADPPTPGQIQRVATWLATVTVNDATWSGSGARGVRFKAWRSMKDSDVRESHVRADGQVANIGGKFLVGGYRLRYPGEPVGPPSIWINCRCVTQPVSREGEPMSATTFAMTDEVVEIDEDEELPVDELEDGEEEITEIPVHGVLAPEGVMSGDRRIIRENAMSWRELPIPLRYETVGSHGGDTSHVVTVGRVDEIWREGNLLRYKGAISVNRPVSAEVIAGIVDGTVRGVSIDGDAAEIEEPRIRENEDGTLELEDPDMEGVTAFTALRTAGLTIVPIPAFQEAYIGLGHEFQEDMTEEQLTAALQALSDCGCTEKGPEEDENPDIELAYDAWKVVDLSEMSEEELATYNSLDSDEQERFAEERGYLIASAFAPGTKDGPGWITHPIPTSRIRRYWVRGKGAAKIRWGVPGDFNRCRRQLVKYVQNPDWLAGLCANMHKEALGVWPGRERGGAHKVDALVASVRIVTDEEEPLPSKYFQHHGRKELIGVEMEGDHIFGYIAHWGVCHIGMAGVCTTAPKSYSNYSRFRTGKVLTDAGFVPVGQITMDTGHANVKAREAAAVAHYDNTGTAVADVTCGEDELGIWFSGMLRPGVTAEQKRALRAAGRVSGDWRDYRGTLELVAALAVNVPGFPVPNVLVAAGAHGQTALIAAGVVEAPAEAIYADGQPARVGEDGIPILEDRSTDPSVIAAIARASVQEYIHILRLRERAEPLRKIARDRHVASLRRKIEGK